MLNPEELASLIDFRRELHRFPELSGQEEMTAARIRTRLQELEPDVLLENVGGHGLITGFVSPNPGPSILVRTDIDALPIQEHNSHDHLSQHPGVAHLCGHDGHATIGVALAAILSKHRPEHGNVYILFQPSEENGTGAQRVLEDPKFKTLKIDQVLALHNLPGYNENEILVKDGPFACASTGLRIHFEGKSAHAAEPENGINPADGICALTGMLGEYRETGGSGPFRLATIVHVKVGNEAYGISPGTGVLALTLRAETDKLLEAMEQDIRRKAGEVARDYQVSVSFSRLEPFSATVNQRGFSELVTAAAESLSLQVQRTTAPFRWSEDVGLLVGKFGGGLFGLGAGERQPALHNPDYDFPDRLIETGAKIFYEIITHQQQNAPHVVH